MLMGDPDGMNQRRVEWARKAIGAFIDATHTDEKDALVDLLCDLIHYADSVGVEFETAVTAAQGHYRAEIGDE
jgi:hypothetical protein